MELNQFKGGESSDTMKAIYEKESKINFNNLIEELREKVLSKLKNFRCI